MYIIMLSPFHDMSIPLNIFNNKEEVLNFFENIISEGFKILEEEIRKHSIEYVDIFYKSSDNVNEAFELIVSYNLNDGIFYKHKNDCWSVLEKLDF